MSDPEQSQKPSTPDALPLNIERLLHAAANDEEIRSRLIRGREWLSDPSLELTESEREILRAVPAEQLGQMIDAVGRAKPPFPTSADLEPQWVCQGIRPYSQWSPVRGIRPHQRILRTPIDNPGCIVVIAVLAALIALVWMLVH